MPPKRRKQVKKVNKKQLKSHIVAIVVLAVFCFAIVLPNILNQGIGWLKSKTNLNLPKVPAIEFNLGLDLQGGAHLVYQADTKLIADKDQADSVEGVRDVIEKRVRGGLGVSEPIVQTTKVGKDYRIIVELPGVKDVNKAIKMIGKTPVLEFKEENNIPPRALTSEETKQMNEFNKKAEDKAKKALDESLKPGADFAKLVKDYSEDEQTKEKSGEMGYISQNLFPEMYKWASTAKNNDISKTLIKSSSGLNVVKKLGERESGKEVSASHLLICYKGATKCDNPKFQTKEEAKKKIEELKKQATAKNFSDLVKKNSTEPNADKSGGELGWFRKGQMVKEFEDKTFSMATGTISDVVETGFGLHLIYKKDERPAKDFNLARIFIKTKTAADVVPPEQQWKTTGLSGKYLKRAEVTQDQQSGQIQVSLNFDSEGSKLFAEITKKNVGKTVAIFLDGQPISIPRVNESILSGSAVITGGFTVDQARVLVRRLNSGALPVPIHLISQQKVDATLGADSLQKSYRAALLGLLLVIIFMILYYRLPGLIAAFSLAIYGLLAMAIFKGVGVTLTLSGIAGFILSLGMAVDANVLIFERLKEELKSGRSLRPSIEDAFNRAWPSIRDGNITTLISTVFLIWFGTGFVQGFAVTLAIGVLSSMFTAIIITKAIMRFVSYFSKESGNRLYLGYNKAKK